MEQTLKKKGRGRKSIFEDNRVKHICTGTVATSLMHNKEEKPLLISLH